MLFRWVWFGLGHTQIRVSYLSSLDHSSTTIGPDSISFSIQISVLDTSQSHCRLRRHAARWFGNSPFWDRFRFSLREPETRVWWVTNPQLSNWPNLCTSGLFEGRMGIWFNQPIQAIKHALNFQASHMATGFGWWWWWWWWYYMTRQQLYKQSIYHQQVLINLLIRRWHGAVGICELGAVPTSGRYIPKTLGEPARTGRRSTVCVYICDMSMVVSWWNGLSALYVRKWPNVDPDSTQGHFTEVGKLWNRHCTREATSIGVRKYQ